MNIEIVRLFDILMNKKSFYRTISYWHDRSRIIQLRGGGLYSKKGFYLLQILGKANIIEAVLNDTQH